MKHNRMIQDYYDIARGACDPELTYGVLWPARVVSQDPETLELDVLVDHEMFRGDGASHIPLKSGVAGFTSRVKKGDRVLIGFEEADPSKPFAMMFEPTEAVVEFNGGKKPMARVDDTVHCGFLVVQTAPTPGTFHFTADQELEADAARAAIVLAGGAATVLPLTGKITSGNDKLTA